MKPHSDLALLDLYEAGYDALVEKLGLAGAEQFLQLLQQGSGNYTEERRELFKDITLEQAIAEMRKFMPPEEGGGD